MEKNNKDNKNNNSSNFLVSGQWPQTKTACETLTMEDMNQKAQRHQLHLRASKLFFSNVERSRPSICFTPIQSGEKTDESFKKFVW